MEMLLDDLLHWQTGPRDPAGQLTRQLAPLVEGESVVARVAILTINPAPIHCSSIDPWWRSGLEARNREPQDFDVLGHRHRRRIAHTTGGNLPVRTHMNAATQERTGSDDYRAARE